MRSLWIVLDLNDVVLLLRPVFHKPLGGVVRMRGIGGILSSSEKLSTKFM